MKNVRMAEMFEHQSNMQNTIIQLMDMKYLKHTLNILMNKWNKPKMQYNEKLHSIKWNFISKIIDFFKS